MLIKARSGAVCIEGRGGSECLYSHMPLDIIGLRIIKSIREGNRYGGFKFNRRDMPSMNSQVSHLGDTGFKKKTKQ